MTRLACSDDAHAAPVFNAARKSPRAAKPRATISPVTLRLTPNERARLEELAVGMTLSAYIRGCLFAEETRRRKARALLLETERPVKAIAADLGYRDPETSTRAFRAWFGIGPGAFRAADSPSPD